MPLSPTNKNHEKTISIQKVEKPIYVLRHLTEVRICELAVLTADPRGPRVMNAELWFVQIRHGQPGPATSRKLHLENTRETH